MNDEQASQMLGRLIAAGIPREKAVKVVMSARKKENSTLFGKRPLRRPVARASATVSRLQPGVPEIHRADPEEGPALEKFDSESEEVDLASDLSLDVLDGAIYANHLEKLKKDPSYQLPEATRRALLGLGQLPKGKVSPPPAAPTGVPEIPIRSVEINALKNLGWTDVAVAGMSNAEAWANINERKRAPLVRPDDPFAAERGAIEDMVEDGVITPEQGVEMLATIEAESKPEFAVSLSPNPPNASEAAAVPHDEGIPISDRIRAIRGWREVLKRELLDHLNRISGNRSGANIESGDK